jgi:pimeloyl-ACP methyl ester carboxylesterase
MSSARQLPIAAARPSRATWPWQHTKPWTVNYLAWDHATARQAIVVLPREWGPNHHPHALPLVISPHGRNNHALNNARGYWQNLPAAGPFALVCPDGLARAHSAQTDPVDLPPNPSLFTYGNVGHVHDLARMPKIVEATLPWLRLQRDRVYVLGSSMGGQETLLLAARYPNALSGGHGKLAGAAAFDATCDLAVQCGYLTNHNPGVAANMIEEVGRRPASTRGWNLEARYFNRKRRRQETIGSLLAQLPKGQAAWNQRSALSFTRKLASLPFPLRLYWSTEDVIVGNQQRDQTGKLFTAIERLAPNAHVTPIRGQWAHSHEFFPGKQLGAALAAFGLISQV